MLRIKVRNWEGKLIMILHQNTEHVEDKEIELYKVVIEIRKDTTVTLERVRIKEMLIYGREE